MRHHVTIPRLLHNHQQRTTVLLLLLRLLFAADSLTHLMDAFYGPHHERPSGLCLVTGALSQSRETVARGLPVPEIRAYVLERYPWSSEPMVKKKGRQTASGDEATNLINEGIVAGVKNQIFRTTTEGGETKVFTTPKLRQMFPSPTWARKRARESLNEVRLASDSGVSRVDTGPAVLQNEHVVDYTGSERVHTPHEKIPLCGPSAKKQMPKEEGHSDMETSVDACGAEGAMPNAQTAEGEPETPGLHDQVPPKLGLDESPGDPLPADGKLANQRGRAEQTELPPDWERSDERNPRNGTAPAVDALQLAPEDEEAHLSPAGPRNADSREAHVTDQAASATSMPPPADGEVRLAGGRREETAPEGTAVPRRRRSARMAQEAPSKRRRTSRSPPVQPPPGRRRSSRLR